MNRSVLIFVVMLHSFFSCGQSTYDQLLLGNVYAYFGKVVEQERKVEVRKRFDSFDWIDGKPGDGILSCKGCFDVGYDSKNGVIEVLYLDHQSPFNGCRMKFYAMDGLRFMTLEKNRGGKYLFLPIFFVTSIETKEIFMLNTCQQTGPNPRARALFGDSFPLSAIEDISSIMILDDMFMPKFNLRFSNGKAFLGSEILYGKDKFTVEKEYLYLMNVEGVSDGLALSGALNLRTVGSVFEGATDFNITAVPDIQDEFLIYPLWLWGGAYTYR